MLSYIHRYIVPAAYAVLPEAMRSAPATALLLAIGLQESSFADRRQLGGPARSFFQFEQGGVQGVLAHHKSRLHAEAALAVLAYPKARWTAAECYAAIEHNDVLAVVFARLLLYTLPDDLPLKEAASDGWQQYLSAWRPGKPRPNDWANNYTSAWTCVEQ